MVERPNGTKARSVCNSSKYTSTHIRPTYAEVELQNCNIQKKTVHTANLPRQEDFVRQLSVDSINQDSSVVGPLHAGEKTPKTATRKVTRCRKGSGCCTGGHCKKSRPLWTMKDACRNTTIKSLRDTFQKSRLMRNKPAWTRSALPRRRLRAP